jgi:hypothetical protein
LTAIVAGLCIAWILLACGMAVLIGRAMREADLRDGRCSDGFETASGSHVTQS